MYGRVYLVHDVDLHGDRQAVHASAHGAGMATLFGLRYPKDRLRRAMFGIILRRTYQRLRT